MKLILFATLLLLPAGAAEAARALALTEITAYDLFTTENSSGDFEGCVSVSDFSRGDIIKPGDAICPTPIPVCPTAEPCPG